LSAQVENASVFLEEQQAVQLVTVSGTTYEGVIIIVLQDKITIQTFDGAQVAIAKSKIKALAALDDDERVTYADDDELYEGKYRFPNPMPNRNFITETAFAIEQGKGFYQNVMVFVNTFGYGITDHFSVSAGFESVSLFLGERPGLIIQPKYTFTERTSNTQIAVGANLITAPGNGNGVLGTIYSAATFGDINQNLTVGVALPFTSEEFADNNIFFQLGGQYRVADSFGFVTDNVFRHRFCFRYRCRRSGTTTRRKYPTRQVT